MRSKSVVFYDENGNKHVFGAYRSAVRFFDDKYNIKKTPIDDVLYRKLKESKQKPELINENTLYFVEEENKNGKI